MLNHHNTRDQVQAMAGFSMPMATAPQQTSTSIFLPFFLQTGPRCPFGPCTTVTAMLLFLNCVENLWGWMVVLRPWCPRRQV